VVVLTLVQYGQATPGNRAGGLFAYGPFPILLVVLLVLFTLRIVFWSRMWGYRGGPRRSPGWDPAVVTARQRYARGEISREQYDQLMTDLSRRRPGR
jgi:uncharacterized membrane protein